MSQSAEQKHPGWYSACYAFAEGVRELSNGKLNNKRFYALVSVLGPYVNHYDPAIRKSTAASLSHRIHSSQYAFDLRERYTEDPSVFAYAALELSSSIMRYSTFDKETLPDYVLLELWPEIRKGLQNEILDGRVEVNMARVDSEFSLLQKSLAAKFYLPVEQRLSMLFEQLFYLICFAHIDERVANGLVDELPTDVLQQDEIQKMHKEGQVCLMKTGTDDDSTIQNIWIVDAQKEFVIGRYTDCDAIEMDRFVSRKHCSLTWEHGVWVLYDKQSSLGTAVERDGEIVWSSLEDDAGSSFVLQFGDSIILADRVRYWFAALQNAERLMLG